MQASQNQDQPDDDENRWEIASRHYFDKLTELISTLDFGDELSAVLTVKHYFNGAAVYAGQSMCASWSPVGLAFRLPAAEVAELIAKGQAKPLKYFAKSRIRKSFALFDDPESKQQAALKTYFLKAADQASLNQVENLA